MQIFALSLLCGVFTSILIPETRRKTLEELAGESESNLAYELRFVERFWRPTSAEIREERRRYQKRSSFLGLSQKYFRFSG
jgi:PHS family inorganic phosphate transporter-like MFS transporter